MTSRNHNSHCPSIQLDGAESCKDTDTKERGVKGVTSIVKSVWIEERRVEKGG